MNSIESSRRSVLERAEQYLSLPFEQQYPNLAKVHLVELVASLTSAPALSPEKEASACKTCRGSGMVAYWDGSALAGEMCPDCEPKEPAPLSPEIQALKAAVAKCQQIATSSSLHGVLQAARAVVAALPTKTETETET